jgi:hypothetical protein
MEEAAQTERVARFLNVISIEHHVYLVKSPDFLFYLIHVTTSFMGSVPSLEGKHQCCEVLLKQNIVVFKILPDL